MFPGIQLATSKAEWLDLRDASLRDVVLWLVRRRHRFQVTGISMLPGLSPGDEVLIDRRAYRLTSPQVGDVVVSQSPRELQRRLIKRVIAVQADGSCFLRGDNPEQSTDSRVFGWVPANLILGRVMCRF